MNIESFKIKHIFASLCVAAVALLSFNFFYIFPLFDDFLLSSMESDAVQIATHIRHLCAQCPDGVPPPAAEIKKILQDFDLRRV